VRSAAFRPQKRAEFFELSNALLLLAYCGVNAALANSRLPVGVRLARFSA
jgi:hypothetical protein